MDTSYLSRDVRYMLVDIFNDSESILDPFGQIGKNSFAFHELLEDHDEITKLVFKENQLQKKSDFHTAVKELYPLFFKISRWKYTPSQVETFAKSISLWIFNISKEVVARWFNENTSIKQDKTQIMLHMLHITASLERALRNTYHLKDENDPFLLRDLICSSQLKEIFGEIEMKFLQVLFGGPLSLNLRNLVWHGFVSPSEIPPIYFSTLLFVVLHMSMKIAQGNLHTQIKNHCFVPNEQLKNLLKERFDRIDVECAIKDGSINDCFEISPYISAAMLPYFHYSVALYRASRFGECVILLLPQLEHLLRCRYALCNQCPSRMMTAESAEFYTTMDEVLCKTMKGGERNQIKDELGDGLMVLLMDLFQLQDGMRLRDRLSHGEMLTTDVDQNIASIIILTALAASHKLWETNRKQTSVVSCEAKSTNDCKKMSILMELEEILLNYDAVFHVLAFTKRDVILCLNNCSSFKSVTLPGELTRMGSAESLQNTQLSILLCDLTCKYIEIARKCTSDNSKNMNTGEDENILLEINVDLEIDRFLKEKISTLHRSDPNNVILKQISSNLKKISGNIKNGIDTRRSMFEDRTMRSRQRKNFCMLLLNCPVFYAGLQLLSTIVLLLIYRSMMFDQAVQRKLKRLLQICENAATYTSSDVNKWNDTVMMMNKLRDVAADEYLFKEE